MIWIFINFLIMAGIAGYTLFLVRNARVQVEIANATNLSRLEDERKIKQKTLEDLAFSIPGLVSMEEVESRKEELVSMESKVNVDKGKCAITEAEIDALDIRLRELEELRRELEVSNMDAIKEVEMLKAQERDISNQNAAIKEQLSSSLDQIDILLDMLHNNVEAVDQLNKSKSEMTTIESKIGYYEEAVNKINMQYVGLKRAYDALDIEYAQLYEKRQNEMEEESGS